jgi:ABC-2 type transport system ATP-binding protein
MLEARALLKRYRGVPVVSDVHFSVGPGEVLGYLGPNGSGKSTTVQMILGLVTPDGGHVRYRGTETSEDLVAFRAVVGYVPEEAHVYPYLSGREYLELIGRLRLLTEASLQARLGRFMELLGLSSCLDVPMHAYSKGMRQKILIIAALMHNPEILVLDEPMAGLDAISAILLRHLIQMLADAGKIIFYSSHELDAVERVATRVVVLDQGRVVADGSVSRLKALVSEPSLESVFSRLVVRDDPADRASQIVDAMLTRG